VPASTTQLHVRVSPLAFTQPNDSGAAAILSAVAAGIHFLQTNGMRTAQVWDLFCGNGSIGLACIQTGLVASVVGIDFNLQAIQDAVHTAVLNDIGSDRVQFHCADLTSAPITSTDDDAVVQAPPRLYAPVVEHADYSRLMVSKAGIHLPRPDVIIVDPPRAGVGKLMLQVLLQAAPPAIIYVSCNPASFAGDCKHLASMYDVRLVQPIDQFAHTNHVENVAILMRR
jgi:23S rRNA (uracil1939-C5)-methyltransferase